MNKKIPPAKLSADNIIPDGQKRTKPPQEGQYKEAKNRKPGKKVKSRSGSVADLSEEPQGAAGGAASSDPNLDIDDTNFTTAGFSAESTVIEPDYRKDLNRKRSTTNKSFGDSPLTLPKPPYNPHLVTPLPPDRQTPAKLIMPDNNTTNGGAATPGAGNVAPGSGNTAPGTGNTAPSTDFDSPADKARALKLLKEAKDAEDLLNKTNIGIPARLEADELLRPLNSPKDKDVVPTYPILIVKLRGKDYSTEFDNLMIQRDHILTVATGTRDTLKTIRELANPTSYDVETLQRMTVQAENYHDTLSGLDSRLTTMLEVSSHATFRDWADIEVAALSAEISLAEGFLIVYKKPVSEVLSSTIFGNISLITDPNTGQVTSRAEGPLTSTFAKPGFVRSPKITDKDLHMIKWNGHRDTYWKFKVAVDDLFGSYDHGIVSWIRKFTYMRQVLPHSEHKRLASFSPDKQGWNEFWQDMGNRYGNELSQMYIWLGKLRGLPSVKQSNGLVNFHSLEHHYEEASNAIRMLAKFGKTADKCWQEFLPFLAGKLDPVTSLEWNTLLQKENWEKQPVMDAGNNPVSRYMKFIKEKLDLFIKVKNDHIAIRASHRDPEKRTGTRPKVRQVTHTETFVTETPKRSSSSARKRRPRKNPAPKKTPITLKLRRSRSRASSRSKSRSSSKSPRSKSPKTRSKSSSSTYVSKEPKNCFIHPTESHKPWDCPNLGDPHKLWAKIYGHPEKICVGCFHLGHYLSKCKKSRECGIGGCKQKHHRKVHFAQSAYIPFHKWKKDNGKGSSGKK